MEKRTMGKRIYRDPTEEQAAKYRKIREMIAAEMPEIKKEVKALRQGRRVKIQEAVSILKAERELRGLSLGDISERTGISKSAISKLENNQDANPTINTLAKYADALRMVLSITLTDRV
jgi:hypothetical protein